ncbi:MAG: hypothetical protein ABIH63_01785 [archaeon]
MNILCVKCKGRRMCGRSFCPILSKSEARFRVKKLVEKDFYGSSPAPFVGHVGYPFLNVGILSPPYTADDAWRYDSPRFWSSNDYRIAELVDLRSSLVNSRFNINVKQQSKFLSIAQEVGMASKPVDVEVNLKKKPKFFVNVNDVVAPMGPHAQLEKVRVTENPKVSQKVEKVVSDTDLKAADAVLYLYGNEFDENFLSRILSIGNLGLKKNRKLVPTRWSITAVDDTLGKNFISEVKNYPLSPYQAYFGGYLGNYYLILFFSDVWSYELFETYLPKASWNVSSEVQFSTDYESYDGRKGYADSTAGGYYAARLPILERLAQSKRQASVLALRFITGEYAVPLGVWVVREASRKALGSTPVNFDSKEALLDYARIFVKDKFKYDLNFIFSSSKMLENIKKQVKLSRFF